MSPASHAPDPRPDLLGLPLPELAAVLGELGVGATHAGRVFGALHRRRLPLDAIPGLGPRRSAALCDGARVAHAELLAAHDSPDATQKLLLAMPDGARVEAVLIPMREGRLTLCVSSQVGCAMGCAFCATARMGLVRGLSAGEIVAQVHAARAHAAAAGQQVTHIVFMGMGEPLHHYAATRDALHILRQPHGLRYASRYLTVSTVGLVPRMADLARDFGGRIQLALSLHAGTDATRRRIIPLAVRHDLASLREACLAHPLPGSRYLMLEYVLLPGVNDSREELLAVADFCRGLRCIVNLIPFNPFHGAPFRPPTRPEVDLARERLAGAGVPVSVRWPRGRVVTGACGQLALGSASD